ncbi:MAG: hypothetical protein ACI9YT_002099 [Halobacteriales archaeon]|jgi:hypothetical protein
MDRNRFAWVPELLRGLLGLTYVVGGLVHLAFWASNRAMYGEIIEFILVGWYRDLWTELVLPNLGVLLPLLALFELALAAAILSSGRGAKVGLAVGAMFNLALAPLGFWWPTNVALALAHLALLRFEFPVSSLRRARNRIARDRSLSSSKVQ